MERDITIRLLGFKGFPLRLETVLGNTAPPIIYLLGNEKLFESRSIGFCGSRKASEKGLEVAKTCGQILAEQSINIVSGYAAGVDMATHVEAISAGGSTIIVFPNGILHFHLKEQISELLACSDLLKILVVSEFPPGIPWKAHNAMIRNRTIVGLADAMIVIESGLEGGYVSKREMRHFHWVYPYFVSNMRLRRLQHLATLIFSVMARLPSDAVQTDYRM